MAKTAFPFRKMEYPSGSIETYASAMARRVVSGVQNCIFEYGPAARPRRRVAETRPSPGEGLEKFSNALASEGVRLTDGSDELDLELANAILDSVRSVSAAKSKSYAAVALEPLFALLSSPSGLKGQASPPNYGALIEDIYELGRGEATGDSSQSASGRWWTSLTERPRSPLLRSTAAALREYLGDAAPLLEGIELPPPVQIERPRWWTAELSNARCNPFRIFHNSWNRLTSIECRDKLPLRQWNDWSNCILRTGLAMSYLWEFRLFDHLGRSLVTAEAIDHPVSLIDWNDGLSITEHDTASPLIHMIRRGLSTREKLEARGLDEVLVNSETLADAASQIGSRPESIELKKTLLDDYRQRKPLGSRARNRWEFVKYNLQARDESDHYGFLTSSGKYTWPSPSTEWVAAWCGVTPETFGDSSHLTDFRRLLEGLGINVEMKTLSRAVEQAGLARNNSDADEALEIAPAVRPREVR